MTNWESVWGNTEKNWKPIDFHDKHILKGLLVASWISMLAFFCFALFTVITKSDVAALLMIAFLFVWLWSGITYIRIKRAKRKYVTVIQ
jgi:chromate transport protein ChrA